MKGRTANPLIRRLQSYGSEHTPIHCLLSKYIQVIIGLSYIMEYTVIHAAERDPQLAMKDISTKVNAMIKEGWEPIGGIASNHSYRFWQAMVRK
jgi:hypothetical protein